MTLRMQKLKKQINESFFNPVLHFLPLIVFMVVDDYWGLNTAWMMSVPVSLVLFFYIYFGYRKIFQWFAISMVIFLFVAIVSTVIPRNVLPIHMQNIFEEQILLLIFAGSLIGRRKIERFINERKSRLHSMANNLNEMFRMIWLLTIVIFFYVHIYYVVSSSMVDIDNRKYVLTHLHNVYIIVLFSLVIYEIVRVTIVRMGLMKEEWWPIVNEQGKMIGSIQHLNSLSDEKKYMHPVIRVMLIDAGRIFLQKRSSKELINPGLWDTALSNHVLVNETVESCINRTAKTMYNLHELKPLFLSNYINETPDEFHYAFLFVACNLTDLKCNEEHADYAKWWTVRQIDDNLDAGIFTDNFKEELELLKRSGLLDTGSCECECGLKEAVKKGSLLYKKSE